MKINLTNRKGEFMKKIILTIALIAIGMMTSTSWAYESVRGYIRSNGTYVAPYIRSSFNTTNAHKSSKLAYVNVRGYIRSNGTYVAPHIRSNPDSNPYNNLSSFNTIKVNQGSPFNPNGEIAFKTV